MTHQELVQHFCSKKISPIFRLSGGDINSVYLVTDGSQKFVAKINTLSISPDLLQKEAEGLQYLEKYSSFNCPKIQAIEQLENYQLLLLEYITSEKPTDQFWVNFGTQLADQHLVSNKQFGFETNNYIGSLKQSNKWSNDWGSFLIEERLYPQIKAAVDNGHINAQEGSNIETIYNHIDSIWPKESSSLLHGDLWSGNFLAGVNNEPTLIDPAVYFGHREMDLGMMHLFGGFDALIFDVYNSIYPLENGWKQRINYNQLYPLLVHLNLFGRSYLSQIQRIVGRF